LGAYDLPALSILVRCAIASALVGRTVPDIHRSTPLSLYVVPMAQVETRQRSQQSNAYPDSSTNMARSFARGERRRGRKNQMDAVFDARSE
jgi:hypothetical protein